MANAVSDGLDEVSSERAVHLELLLKEKKYSICSTAARQHATGKTCDPRTKSIIMCFEVFRQ